MEPLIFDSDRLLDLPPICMRCGRETHHVIASKPIDPKTWKRKMVFDFATSFIPVFHLLNSLSYLNSPTAKLPLCSKCAFSHFLPNKSLVFGIFLTVAFLVAAFYSGLREDDIFMLIYVAATICALVYVVRKSAAYETVTMPVQVFKSGEKFRYVVFGGPLYSVLSLHAARNAERPKTLRS